MPKSPVSIRALHTRISAVSPSAYVCIRQHTSPAHADEGCPQVPLVLSIRQHTSAYVSIPARADEGCPQVLVLLLLLLLLLLLGFRGLLGLNSRGKRTARRRGLPGGGRADGAAYGRHF
jgi:hypothetical protein